MKKIINSSDTLVAEMCSGIALFDSNLKYVQKYNFIKKRYINNDKVTPISLCAFFVIENHRYFTMLDKQLIE